ncbi:hypothetical protein KQ51_00960 [Candidatus Izimaplasma bacterium HR1]|jgi:hypothetical protein|uniref:hypothetical protein n=1 Tax=Candidatus Izimoplasma sp. HR1 TaxID=1541959 RepID=UPI0004F64144|nr:hypothetical protein KQ51_00960 [Candidatus Izimaplasma bacterium HR1]
MSPERFIFMAILFIVPCMYGISMLWYFFISKKRGIYFIEILVSAASLIGMIMLFSIAYSADMGDALAALFGSFFLIPVIVGALVAALLVKLTIVFLTDVQTRSNPQNYKK